MGQKVELQQGGTSAAESVCASVEALGKSNATSAATAASLRKASFNL
jgi:hypothetical protein